MNEKRRKAVRGKGIGRRITHGTRNCGKDKKKRNRNDKAPQKGKEEENKVRKKNERFIHEGNVKKKERFSRKKKKEKIQVSLKESEL